MKRIPALCILLLFCMVPVQLGEGSPNVRVSGQVRGEDNQPIANCWVGAYDGNWKSLGVSTRTDVKGGYELLVPVLDSYIVDIGPAGSLKSGVYAFDYFGLAKKVWRQDATSVTVDFILQQVGNLVLKAFDVGGNLMRAKDFGWGTNIYATDENGIRTDDRFSMLHDTLSSAKNWDNDLRLPAVMVLLNHPRSINLLWSVYGFGWIRVLADNGGQGFSFDRKGDVLIINLNYELARTQLTMVNGTLETCIKDGYTISEKVLAEINRARQFFADASTEKDDGMRAILSDKALNCSLHAGEELEYEKAQQSIERYRKKGVTLRILDEAGKPLSSAQINYVQTSHDFFFGGSSTENAWVRAPNAVRLMKDAGMNYVPVGFYWGKITERAAAGGIQISRDWADLTVQGHCVVWFHKEWGIGKATYLYSLTFPQLRDEVYSHVQDVVGRYKDRVHYWTLVNEVECNWCNHWNMTLDEMSEIVRVSCKAARETDPSATIILNFAIPGGEAAGYRNGVLGETRGYVPFELLQRIIERKIDFDVIGLQLYYGAADRGTPARDAFSISRMIDWYAQFNKTIFITEASVGSSPSPMANYAQQGFWHSLPSEQTQSDWLRLLYTNAYANPHVGCITWWDATDFESFIYCGGLMNELGQPKLAYYTLKELVHAWTTQGAGTTNSDGILQFRGFAGNYEVQVDGYDPAEVHVSEHGSNEITVTLKKQIIHGVRNVSIYVVMIVSVIAALVGLLARKRSKSQSMRRETKECSSETC